MKEKMSNAEKLKFDYDNQSIKMERLESKKDKIKMSIQKAEKVENFPVGNICKNVLSSFKDANLSVRLLTGLGLGVILSPLFLLFLPITAPAKVAKIFMETRESSLNKKYNKEHDKFLELSQKYDNAVRDSWESLNVAFQINHPELETQAEENYNNQQYKTPKKQQEMEF